MKIAIIGSGIAGLGAAYLLSPKHEITVYEKNDYIGGHSRTVEINDGTKIIPVDTGFIVFNHRNYPNLSRLFMDLEVIIEKSEMSFGVSINHGWLEYGTKRIFNLFAQKKNLLRPKFWKMLIDILKFNRFAKNYLNQAINLGQCLDELGVGQWFREYYLLAMGAAIWSTPLECMLQFPAKTFIQFFENHGLLSVSDKPQWYTVKGGSKEYIKRLVHSFKHNIKLACSVEKVLRKKDHVEIHCHDQRPNQYDQVIFACHADEALAILEGPTQDETDILSSIRYQSNQIILHSDISFMQRNKKTWSSWVFLSETSKDHGQSLSLSYWMNNLQSLHTEKPIIVTLNPGREPAAGTIYDHYVFRHPLFDHHAIDAQAKLSHIQGKNKIWYCGAWQQYGFHEDGLLSAIHVAASLGAEIPWK